MEVTMETKTVQCQCGEWDGQDACWWEGPIEDTVLVEFVPDQYRGTALAAGDTSGMTWTIRVERECAQRMLEFDPEWVWIVVE
jgi:hypothetical protein